MMMPYIQIFADKEDALNLLGDAERGRLLSALLEYNRTGVCPELTGNERLVFPFFREGVDAARRLYEAKATAGGKGGSKSKQKQSEPEAEASTDQANGKQKQAEGKQTEANESKSKQTEANDPKNKNKNKNKNTSSSPSSSPFREGFIEEGEEEELAQRINDVFDAAQDAGFALTAKGMDVLNNLVAKYDADTVLDAITYCVEHTTQGKPSYAYLRKVIEDEKEKPTAPAPAPYVPNARFTFIDADGKEVDPHGLPTQS